MRTGLELWARRAGVRVDVVDDGSKPERAARIHEELVARGYRFVLGPYGSDCTRKVAEARAGSVVWNHGAAADDVQRLPGVVSVATPASRYLVALGRAVADLRPGAAAAVITAPGRFARFAREGLEREAGSLGIELVSDLAEADAVLLCGPLQWECERLRSLIGSGRLLGGLAPGLAAFHGLLGADPEGMLAPVQWHPDLERTPELGPASLACRGLRRSAGLRRCADRRPLPRAQLAPTRSRLRAPFERRPASAPSSSTRAVSRSAIACQSCAGDLDDESCCSRTPLSQYDRGMPSTCWPT